MTRVIEKLFPYRVRALIRKEMGQIRRNRRLGVVDESRSPESRELIAVLSESKSFRLAGTYFSSDDPGVAISEGKLDAGVVIPYDYTRNLLRGRVTTVQFLLNAMNANTAAIAQAYAEGVIQTGNLGLAGRGLHANFSQIAAPDVSHRGRVLLQPAFLYNPGLVSSWSS